MNEIYLSENAQCTQFRIHLTDWGGRDGAMVLGKLPVPGPTNWDLSRCGWGCLNIISIVYHFSFLSPSLSGRRSDID